MDLDTLFRTGVIDDLDLSFARMVARIDAHANRWVVLAAALVSKATAEGDVCLDLKSLCENGFVHSDGVLRLGPEWPVDQWQAALLKSDLVGNMNQYNVMILDGNRLYLQRYWKYEATLAASILSRCDETSPGTAMPGWNDLAVPPLQGQDPDQQRAIAAALSHRFTVISGGPGTGKTHTIATIIAMFNRLQRTPPGRILIAAPTGKAAARLQEALDDAFMILSGGGLIDALPITARTVHRLLGAVATTSRYRHHRDNPLAADVVIIDEASMLDLALAAKLFDAVPPDARLILVGDKDQLASVEAGAVMGDICGGPDFDSTEAGHPAAPIRRTPAGRRVDLSNHIVILQKNYRFKEDSGIHRLGQAVKKGAVDTALSLLEDSAYPDITWRRLSSGPSFEAALQEKTERGIMPLFSMASLPDLLAQLVDFKILTAVRRGPLGVGALNAMVESMLRAGGRIPTTVEAGESFYHGKPVMISRNDYQLNLFNGDIGIALSAGRHGRGALQVAFQNTNGDIHYVVPEHLPPHETVYAMTVHKSQGTEFGSVLLILPEGDLPLLTRELIYTAITRAKRSVEIWALEETLRHAIGRRILRTSGLRPRLWNLPADQA
jgi:exodeoxyribonuclease V alpha subunit